jgi:hypothetical protein
MFRMLLCRKTEIASDRLTETLAQLQYLRPHRCVTGAAQEACRKLGIPEMFARQAIAQLGLDPVRLIGRLRRTELCQLARCIRRQTPAPPAAVHEHDPLSA